MASGHAATIQSNMNNFTSNDVPSTHPNNVLEPVDNSMKFKLNPDRDNRGYEFENEYIAKLALELTLDDKVKTFSLSSNDVDCKYKGFDDINLELEVSDENVRRYYYMQLKYTVNDSKPLRMERLTGPKGPFSISRYYKQTQSSSQTVKIKDYGEFDYFVLVTNHTLDMSSKPENILVEDIKISLISNPSTDDSLFKKTDKNCKCYRFQTNDKPFNENSEERSLQSFLKKLILITNSTEVDAIKRDIQDTFQKKFDCAATGRQYLQYIEQWMKQRKKIKLDKDLMKYVLAIQLLSPHTIYLTFKKETENKKINCLRQAIDSFSFTYLRGDSADKITNMWSDQKDCLSNKQVEIAKSRLQIVDKEINSIDGLTDEERTKVLWVLGKCPLIVKLNNSTKSASKLCRTGKFIFVSDKNEDIININSIFRNLLDLKNLFLLDNILNEFDCKLQGKRITLKDLVNENDYILKLITTDRLVEMVHTPLEIDQAEKLPESHLERKISKNIIKKDFLNQLSEDTIVLCSVSGNGNIKNAKMVELKKLLTNEVHTCSIYTVENYISFETFVKICEKNETKTCHQFKLTKNKELEWVRSNGNVEELRRFQISEVFIKEDDLENDNKINIVCDDPGMGKTTFLKSLKNKKSPTSMTILIEAGNHRKHFQQPKSLEDFVDYFINKASNNSLTKELFRILLQEGRVNFFWDGLDEVLDENLKNVISIIKTLHQKYDCEQWITSRNELKIELENEFHVLSRTIRGFDKASQEKYISNRCKNVPFEKICEKMVQGEDLLKNPQFIFMLTELIKSEGESVLGGNFSEANLYEKFVESTLERHFNEEENNNDMIHKRNENIKSDQITKLRKASLRLYFNSTVLTKWKINFKKKLTKDIAGFIKGINQNRPLFIHESFGEFFAASFLAENPDFVKDIEDFHEDKFTNIRHFFDLIVCKNCPAHMAVLTEDLDLLDQCTDDEKSKKDAIGRTALELAYSLCKKYKVLKDSTRLSQIEFVEPDEETKKILIEKLKFLSEERDTLGEMLNHSKYISDLLISMLMNEKHKDSLKNVETFLSYSARFDYDYVFKKFPSCWEKVIGTDGVYALLRWGSINVLKEFFGSKVGKKILEETKGLLDIPCDNGDVEIVKLLIEKGVSVNEVVPFGLPPLYRACSRGHFKVVEVLVRNNVNVDFPDKNGQTPLHRACENGHFEITELLIENKAKQVANQLGQRPIHLACSNGHYKIVEFLLDRGEDINIVTKNEKTPIHLACDNNHLKIATLLIERGAALDISDENDELPIHVAPFEIVTLLMKRGSPLYNPDKYGLTPIHRASKNGWQEVVEFLIKQGVSRVALDDNGQTLIHQAASSGHLQVVKLLIREGIEIDATDVNGEMAIHLALINRHYDVVKLLIEEGARLDVPDESGLTLLHRCCEYGHEEIAELLIQKQVSLDEEDAYGLTPLERAVCRGYERVVEMLLASHVQLKSSLFLACEKGHIRIIALLMKEGAALNIPNDEGQMPIHLACSERTVKFLNQQGQSCDVKNGNGETPLHVVCRQGNEKVAKLLLEQKVSLNVTNNQGHTPLFVAYLHKNYNIFEMLHKKGADLNPQDLSLRSACHNDNYKFFKLLIKNGISVQVKDRNDECLLHIACRKGDVKVVKKLLKAGATLDATNNNGETALHEVCFDGHEKIAKLLIEKGPQMVDVASKNGETPLDFAYFTGRDDIVKLLEKKMNKTDADSKMLVHKTCARGQRESFGKFLAYANDDGGNLEVANLNVKGNSNISSHQPSIHLACAKGNKDIIESMIQREEDLKNIKDENGETPIQRAYYNEQMDVVSLLLEKGVEVNMVNKYGKMLIHQACEDGRYEIVEKLLKSGAEVNVVNKQNQTPLHIACEKGHYEIVSLLIAKKALLDQQNEDRQLPTHLACENGRYDILKLLVENRAPVNLKDKEEELPIHVACRSGRHKLVKLLMEDEASINVETRNGQIPIHIACRYNHLQIVKLLIEKSELNHRDKNGRLPIHEACLQGNYKVVRLLMEKESSILDKDKEGVTPIHLACSSGSLKLVKLLMKFQADKSQFSIHEACRNGHYEIVKLLIEQVDPNEPNSDKETPLHLACSNGHSATVKLLLNKKVRIDVFDGNNELPIHGAMNNEHFGIVKYLIGEGAKLDGKDKNGNTLLHLACSKGHYEITDLLIQRGVDVNIEDETGSTAIHKACIKGHFDLVKLLSEAGASLDSTDRQGKTPAHLVCEHGNYKIIYLSEKIPPTDQLCKDEVIFEKEFDWLKSLMQEDIPCYTDRISSVLQSRKTCYKGCYKIVKLKMKKQKYITEKWVEVDVFVVCYNGHFEILKYLAGKGVRLDLRDHNGRLPIHWSSKNRQREMVKFLLKQKAN